jgi:glutamate--cysteine ligase
VDLRDAGFKMSAIDANTYPAGFNNLCDSFIARGAELLREFVTASFGGVERIAIYPESHTRNKHYFQNLVALKAMVEHAGFRAIIATLDPRFPAEGVELEAIEGDTVRIERLTREGDVLRSRDFVPDLILINNDFSDGRPDELLRTTQPQAPPPDMGWYVRTKWDHFRIYDSLVREFAEILAIDPWLLSPLTDFEGDVDFKTGRGMDRIAAKTDSIIERVAAKYREYGIDRKPLVFVKDNAGTYGMGIIVIESGKDLLRLNRSQRNKMSRGKGGSDIKGVIVQECVPTAEYYRGNAGEPVIYLIGDEVIGGFLRYSDTKSETESLNSPGTQFAALCLTREDDLDKVLVCYPGHCSFRLYYTVARISCLAMGQEMKDRRLCPETASPGVG